MQVTIPDGVPVISACFTEADHIRAFTKDMCEEAGQLLVRLEAEGLNIYHLVVGIRRLMEIEKAKRPGCSQNRTRNLEKTLRTFKAVIDSLEDELNSTLYLDPPGALRRICSTIENELKDAGVNSILRGPMPKTRITVALIACVREQTKRPHWKAIADLISYAYTAHGLNKKCTVGRLKQIWKNHRASESNWRTLLNPHPFLPTTQESCRGESNIRGATVLLICS